MFVKAIFWPKGVQLSPYPHRWSTGQTAPPRPPPPPTVPASPAARLAGAAGCGRQRRRRRRASGDTALRLASEGPRAVWKVTPLGCFIWATTGGWSGRYQWSSYVGVKLWKLEILTKWQHTHTHNVWMCLEDCDLDVFCALMNRTKTSQTSIPPQHVQRLRNYGTPNPPNRPATDEEKRLCTTTFPTFFQLNSPSHASSEKSSRHTTSIPSLRISAMPRAVKPV